MTREECLFDIEDPVAEAAADARAEADVQAGRLISHNAVKRWVASWGSAKPLQRPGIGAFSKLSPYCAEAKALPANGAADPAEGADLLPH